jgi:hypothetical protein
MFVHYCYFYKLSGKVVGNDEGDALGWSVPPLHGRDQGTIGNAGPCPGLACSAPYGEN